MAYIQVDEFYDLGLRVLQLTHHYDNIYAGGALSLPNKGLSKQGFELIDKLESKHMMIDLSHSSVESALDTLKHAKVPIVQSHGRPEQSLIMRVAPLTASSRASRIAAACSACL